MSAFVSIEPDALVTVGAMISREWGSHGYQVTGVESAGSGSVLAEVTASDGARFHVWSTRYGNRGHATDRGAALEDLRRKIREERTP